MNIETKISILIVDSLIKDSPVLLFQFLLIINSPPFPPFIPLHPALSQLFKDRWFLIISFLLLRLFLQQIYTTSIQVYLRQKSSFQAKQQLMNACLHPFTPLLPLHPNMSNIGRMYKKETKRKRHIRYYECAKIAFTKGKL